MAAMRVVAGLALEGRFGDMGDGDASSFLLQNFANTTFETLHVIVNVFVTLSRRLLSLI